VISTAQWTETGVRSVDPDQQRRNDTMPIIAATFIAAGGTLASLDLRKAWAEYAAGSAMIAGLAAIGAALPVC
jgi:hypothetical protein